MKNIFIYDESESIRGRLPEIIFSGNSAVTVDCVKEILEYTYNYESTHILNVFNFFVFLYFYFSQ